MNTPNLPPVLKYHWWTVGAQNNMPFRIIKVRVWDSMYTGHFSAVEYQIRCRDNKTVAECLEALYDMIWKDYQGA